MITIFGITSLTFMMIMYALEKRGHLFILAFAVGCALSSTYGFLSGAWPFGVVEAIWCTIAIWRYFNSRNLYTNKLTNFRNTNILEKGSE